ncbi:AMP-binding enzyme, partial [Helicosporidium sp. ATCC 50920]
PVYISYLPLAHIYERFFFSLMTYLGAAVGFYRGDVLLLLEDIEALRPTVFCSVPRLWNRIYDRVQAQVAQASAPARALFHAAYASKKAALEAGDVDGGRWAPLWNRLVFGKIKAKLGGRVRVMVSGSAPIAPEVLMFLKICFDAHVIEGYGMTETSASAIVSAPGDPVLGHVGPPLPGVEVKLVDVPEMGYTNADAPHPRGEVCLRGPIVFKGYYKDPVNTAEALDSEGWLHSGDIGAWLPGGRLKIIDRKKNIFKLSQGEYIAPEKIEAVYGRSPFVAQSFVYGDSLKGALVAVVVPDAEHLLPWAATRSWGADLAQLCADPRVRASVLHSMQEEGRAAGLKGFEQVAAVHLHPELFSAENGMLTPTFKLKRPQVQARFQTHIDDMYAAMPK